MGTQLGCWWSHAAVATFFSSDIFKKSHKMSSLAVVCVLNQLACASLASK